LIRDWDYSFTGVLAMMGASKSIIDIERATPGGCWWNFPSGIVSGPMPFSWRRNAAIAITPVDRQHPQHDS